jgi:hypothetical protein
VFGCAGNGPLSGLHVFGMHFNLSFMFVVGFSGEFTRTNATRGSNLPLMMSEVSLESPRLAIKFEAFALKLQNAGVISTYVPSNFFNKRCQIMELKAKSDRRTLRTMAVRRESRRSSRARRGPRSENATMSYFKALCVSLWWCAGALLLFFCGRRLFLSLRGVWSHLCDEMCVHHNNNTITIQ